MRLVGIVLCACSLNALAFLLMPGGGEDLVAVAAGGGVYRLDPASGAATLLGSYGGGLMSSGDLAWTEAGVMATAPSSPRPTDLLVKVDPSTGQAVPVGDIGSDAVWGLAYQKGQLFGFTNSGQVLVVDKSSGAGKVVGTTGVEFWGAASPPPPAS